MDGIGRADAQDPAHTKLENGDNLTRQVDALKARDGSPIFALLPRDLVQGWPYSDGAFMLYALIVAREAMAQWRDEDDEDEEREPVAAPRGGWHGAMGCSYRAVKNWLAELRAKGLIDDLDEWAPGGRRRWHLLRIAFSRELGPLVKIPLGAWRRLGPAEARTWAVICSYTNMKTGAAWPSLATLQDKLRVSRRETVIARIGKLIAAGLVKKARRRRRASGNIYFLPADKLPHLHAEPAPEPPPRTLRTFSVFEGGGNETGLRGGMKPDSGGERDRTQGGNETGHEQEYLTGINEQEIQTQRATRERDAARSPDFDMAESPDASPPAIAGADVLATVEDQLAEAEAELQGWIARQEDAEAKGGGMNATWARIAADKAQEARDRIAALQSEAA